MKQIELTQGKFALVDDEGYEELNKYKWSALYSRCTDRYRAYRIIKHSDGKKQMQLMHREIMNAPKGKQVDHISHDSLDNRKCNLRICTRQQNGMNRLPNKNASSKYKGVCWNKRIEKWQSRIYAEGKFMHLGYFDNEMLAGKAYDERAKELFGEFAYLNFDLWRLDI